MLGTADGCELGIADGCELGATDGSELSATDGPVGALVVGSLVVGSLVVGSTVGTELLQGGRRQHTSSSLLQSLIVTQCGNMALFGNIVSASHCRLSKQSSVPGQGSNHNPSGLSTYCLHSSA